MRLDAGFWGFPANGVSRVVSRRSRFTSLATHPKSQLFVLFFFFHTCTFFAQFHVPIIFSTLLAPSPHRCNKASPS